MDELIKTLPQPADVDYIRSSFHELQEQGAIDAGGFYVSSMNDCVKKGKSLPPLVVLYPNMSSKVTFASSSDSRVLDKGADAGSLMASLNALKKKYNWTLIVLNHVPKMFSGAVSLSLSAIQGSAKLNQLIDDAVGLGRSHKDGSLVYVKQCKWRNGEVVLDADNVALYERAKNGEGKPMLYLQEL